MSLTSAEEALDDTEGPCGRFTSLLGPVSCTGNSHPAFVCFVALLLATWSSVAGAS